MVLQKTCSFRKENGERCRSAPIQDEEFCFWHSPNHTEDADKTRSLGGQRRRREKTLEGAYDLDGMDSVPALRRLLEIVTFAVSLDEAQEWPEPSDGTMELVEGYFEKGKQLMEAV